MGRRGILNTSKYLGSLSTDSEKKPRKKACLTVLSQTNICPPDNFHDACNFVPSSIYYRYSMWLGIARELWGCVFFSWNSSLVLRSPASTSSSPLTSSTNRKHTTSSVYKEQGILQGDSLTKQKRIQYKGKQCQVRKDVYKYKTPWDKKTVKYFRDMLLGKQSRGRKNK